MGLFHILRSPALQDGSYSNPAQSNAKKSLPEAAPVSSRKLSECKRPQTFCFKSDLSETFPAETTVSQLVVAFHSLQCLQKTLKDFLEIPPLSSLTYRLCGKPVNPHLTRDSLLYLKHRKPQL